MLSRPNLSARVDADARLYPKTASGVEADIFRNEAIVAYHQASGTADLESAVNGYPFSNFGSPETKRRGPQSIVGDEASEPD